MSKRKNPPTSLEAFKSLDPEKVNEIYKKIVSALRIIKEGTYEDIARNLKMEPVRIWKRMNEARKMGLIERTENRRKMASGRDGFTWVATDLLPSTEKAIPGKGVVDYSRSLIQPKFTQERLF